MNLSDFYHFQRGHGAVVFISTRTWYRRFYFNADMVPTYFSKNILFFFFLVLLTS